MVGRSVLPHGGENLGLHAREFVALLDGEVGAEEQAQGHFTVGQLVGHTPQEKGGQGAGDHVFLCPILIEPKALLFAAAHDGFGKEGARDIVFVRQQCQGFEVDKV